MAVAIRLARGGSKKRPYYKIIVADSRASRDGKFIERIGSYNPLLAKDDANRVTIDTDRAKHWLSVGAQPSDRVARFLDAAGVRERAARNNPNKGVPGEKAKERAEEREAKAAEAAEAPAVEEVPAEADQAETEAVTASDVEATEKPTPEAEPVVEAAAAEPTPQATPAEDASNEGVSAEAPAEGADEPVAETAEDKGADAPAEGA